MARAATTTDVFNAIAEPRRRAILDALLDGGAHSVGEVVAQLRIPQPTVSKHLGVLRQVGIVSVRRRGRHRLYRLNAEALKPIHDWAEVFDRFWSHQVGRVKERAEQKMRERASRGIEDVTDQHKEGGAC